MKKRLHKVRASVAKPFKKLRERRSFSLEKAKVPMITNETIAEHREEVLAGARKYIYPLQHSKHRIVLLSSIIFGFVVICFFAYSILGLYRFQNTSTFMYRVTQVIPFPIARVEGRYVSYENYLFELRHYMHYYETQQKLSFEDEEGKKELESFKKEALQQVINDAYVKQLASENGVSVSPAEVDQEIKIVRDQNRLGTSDQVFEDVLRDFWGWSINDFKRSLRQQLLARKVASKLDVDTANRAKTAYDELQSGGDFAEIAKKYSDDIATREAGGDYGVAVDQSNRDIPAIVTSRIFAQQPGQYSGIIDTGYSLEIVKTLSFEGDKARAAHMQFVIKDIQETLQARASERPARQYLKL